MSINILSGDNSAVLCFITHKFLFIDSEKNNNESR